mmetsp:Transcript_37910/g.83272  ORF Transcript_37910/g.83272 Transcript_37910/m.83272 type:complete len:504 (-) Transcript_37910:1957-3468(-)
MKLSTQAGRSLLFLGILSIILVRCSVQASSATRQSDQEARRRQLQADTSEFDGSGGGKSSCFPGWDASCQDNPDFASVMGASCSMHDRFDCTMLGAIGYTEEEVYDVIVNCPCSCDIECGAWTITPSAAPSGAPSASPSASPTSYPSSSPSASPTSSPSSIPSESPSSQPSAIPSASPSYGPTGAPSTSMAPSSTPSYAPTGVPTTPVPSGSPTNAPTTSPTISSAPSANTIIGDGKSGSRMYGILGAFAGIVGIAGLAYGVNRRRFSKPWGLKVESKDSYDTNSTRAYNSGIKNSYLHAETKKSLSVNDAIKSSESSDSGGISHCQSIIDNIHSLEAQDSDDRDSDAYRVPMQVEDRLEMVKFPSLKSSSSASSGSAPSFDLEVQASKSKEYGSGLVSSGLQQIAEVDIGEDNASEVGGDDEGYGADVEAFHRPEAPKRPSRPGRLLSISSTDSSMTGRPPLYVNPSFQRVESIGRMTMLSRPQSVDSEGSVELILPHDGSI